MNLARRLLIVLALIEALASNVSAANIEAELLIVGGDESGCAAAVQAARLGVKSIVLVNDIDWLGGQFCTQGIGPIDEWTIVNGKRVDFPISGVFQEIIERVQAHNRKTYGIARPGNSWCGSNTIEPKAAAQIFEDWLAPSHRQLRVLKGWQPKQVLTEAGRVIGVVFQKKDEPPLTVKARLTIDSTDWGDVIRMSGAAYMAGPDLRSRFGEPSAPETLDPGANQEMNPISWCPLLREAGKDSTIRKPARYDVRSFADTAKARLWVDWDGSGGIYNFAGWCIYTHRRMIDRNHFGLASGTEAVILNWPALDYPLGALPQHVVSALEKDEAGASRKNIVEMSLAQREIVFEDAKQRALEFVYWLQTAAHDQAGDFPQSIRYMRLADDYGTADHLPPKPYIREGLRLEALYVMREQDVRTEKEKPLWAKAMVPDGVFGYQFNMDFHPTRRKFIQSDPAQPWHGAHYGTRDWSTHTDRAMFPLRSLVPTEMDGLLGCSKNIGITSMVQSSLRLHGQMMHVGAAAGVVAAIAIRDGVQPRDVASSLEKVREVQRTLVRGSEGPGTLLWPWHDVRPDDVHFEAANMLAISGIWRADRESVFFLPHHAVTRGELAAALARLCRAIPAAKEWPTLAAQPRFNDVPATDADRPFIEAMFAWGEFGSQPPAFRPHEPVKWSELNALFAALKLPTFASLTDSRHANHPLTRAECVDYLYRVLQQRGEHLPADWLNTGSDADGDGHNNLDDALPFDRNNNNTPDQLDPTTSLTPPAM